MYTNRITTDGNPIGEINTGAKAESVLMNLLCTHKEINDLAKKLAEIARCQTTAKQYFDWEPLAIELHKYVIYKEA